MITAVQFYDVVVFLHILAVVLAFGPTFAYGAYYAVAAKHGPQALTAVAQTVQLWNRTANTGGMIVILLSGLYLVEDGPWSFSDFFVTWAFAAILIVFALVHAFFIPNTRRVIAALDSGDAQEAQRLGVASSKAGAVTGILIILTIYVMTAKPFL